MSASEHNQTFFGYVIELLKSIGRAIDQRNMGLVAAGVAFYTMFALFPAMSAMIAIWGFFADPNIIWEYLIDVQELIPGAAYGIIEAQLNSLLFANTSTVSWTTGLSLLVALYAVHNGVAALITGLNAIHGSSSRPGMRRIRNSLLLTFAVIGLFLSALATVVVVPVLLNFLPVGPLEGVVLTLLPWLVMFGLVILVLGLFYRWGPNIDGDRHKFFTPGALIAAFLWALASIAFSTYLSNFGSYNKVYGSIGAVIALLMWLYISAYIVLLGAALNVERARIKSRRNQ